MNIQRTFLCFSWVVLLANAACTFSLGPSQSEIKELEQSIAAGTAPQFVSNDEYGEQWWDWTRQVYTLQGFQPAWTSRGNVLPKADAAIRVLENSSEEGLDPETFGLSHLQAMRKTPSQFDLHLTYSLVGYVSHLCVGRVQAQQIDSELRAGTKKCDVPGLAHNAIQQNSFENLATQLSPAIPEYQSLKSALKKYRDIAAQGSWIPLSSDGDKEAGSTRESAQNKKAAGYGAHSTALASNLVLLGDLEPLSSNETVSNETLKEGLKRFQFRHGLEPDGVLSKKTVQALNVPVEQRIEQIEINMDRMRWMASAFEPHHLRVNIPAFHLAVHRGTEIPLEIRVIVGSVENRTPLLDSQIEQLVFSPYWNIPLSIATKEMLPEIQMDPNYLRKENIEVVRPSEDGVRVVDPSKVNWHSPDGLDYQLRQKPGVTNALGLVKFMFPNPYSVYLHDTPADNLFDRLTRTLSHGCVRVESPKALASYLLADQPEWNDERIEEAMHESKEKHVALKTSLPIHVLYWTAWADAAGKVQFREDVYGYDEKHRQQMSQATGAYLPTSHAAHIHMNKVGTRVVADAARIHRESRLSN